MSWKEYKKAKQKKEKKEQKKETNTKVNNSSKSTTQVNNTNKTNKNTLPTTKNIQSTSLKTYNRQTGSSAIQHITANNKTNSTIKNNTEETNKIDTAKTTKQNTNDNVKIASKEETKNTKKVGSLWTEITNIAENFGLGANVGILDSLNFAYKTGNNKLGIEEKQKDERVLKSNELNNTEKMIYTANKKATSRNTKLPNNSNSDLNNNLNKKINRNLNLNVSYDADKVNTIANKEPIEDMINEKENKIQLNTEMQTGTVSKKLAELAPSIGNMAVGTVASTANPVLGMAYFTQSAGGSYMRDAKERGMSDEEALEYGAIMGVIEGLTEAVGIGNLTKAGKGIKTLVKGTGKTVAKEAVEEVGKITLKQVAKDYGIGIADNFMQEAIIEPIQEATAGIVGGSDKSDWSDMGQRMLKAGIDGGLTSAIIGGADLGIQSCVGVVEKTQNNQQVSTQEIQTAVKDASKQLDVGQMLADSTQQQIKKYKDYNTNEVLDDNTQNVLNKAQNIINQSQSLQQNDTNSQINLQTQQITQEQNKIAQNGNMKQTNTLANNQGNVYNNTERISDKNGQIQSGGMASIPRQFDTRLQQNGEPKQVKKYTRAEYEQFEKSIKPIEQSQLTDKQKTSINSYKRQYNKDIVFFNGKENQGYLGGASLTDKNKIYIDINSVESFGESKVINHEIMESDIRYNREISDDIIQPAIQKIIDDPNFEKQKLTFWESQSEEIPSDYAIAKDILCDRFSELKTGERVDYNNTLSQETNMTIDYALNNFYEKLYGESIENYTQKNENNLENLNKLPTSTKEKENLLNYLDSRHVDYEVDENNNITYIEDERVLKNYKNKLKETKYTNTPPLSEKNIDKYNRYKENIIKSKEDTINNLIKYKNDTIRNIENKIIEKENLLNSKKNKDTKIASTIKMQIERLKEQKTKVENLYNEKIDKLNSKVNKDKIKIEIQNQMKQDAREILSSEIKPLLKDTNTWKDKKMGILYDRETAQRNIYDVIKDKEQADLVNSVIFDPIQEHQANKTRQTNQIFDEINQLKLDKTKKYSYKPEGKQKSIKIDEATIAQLYLENKIDEKQLKKYGVDVTKIKNTASTFEKILDDLYNQMNEVLTQYGYSPIEKRKNYFPHFFENKPDTLLGKVASIFGIDTTNQELPTEIAGKTDTFKPGKTWDGNLLQRKTNKTDYDALKVLERYVNGATDIIHTTEDIQRVREFSREIRYNFSEQSIQERIDSIKNNSELMPFEKEESIDAIFAQEKNQLSHFVTWLDDYANTLANKKSFSDRNIERELGRGIYKNMSSIESRIAANTIGGNLSVSLTNFAPIFQAMGTTKVSNIVVGMLETTKNSMLNIVGKKNNNFVDNSTFLTNRFGVDTISKKTATENVSNFLSKPMNTIDEFTAESIVRAKYRENLQNGMNEEKALKEADKYAGKIMADRSKGALPLVFNQKNPISKLMTMFQVEPNNIVSNYLKDMPNDSKSRTNLAYQYTKLMVASYAFNTMIMAVRGGNEVLPDPIRIVTYLATMMFGDDDDEKEKAKDDLTESLIGSIPFVQNIAGLLGYEDIGRVPISNAMPDITKIGSLFDKNVAEEYKKETIMKEISKPLLYLGLPVGGAQLNKTIQGAIALNNKGSYTTNKDGEKLLQFPIEDYSTANKVRALTLGKWSLPEAQNYTKTLNAKQTKMYEETQLPYKELLNYINAGLKKQDEKIDYISSKSMTIQQKWGIYKYDIFSDSEREDGGSQLKDAEYITSNGVSKSKYIEIYNKAQKNDISMPTADEYKEMKENGLKLDTYIDYKIKVKNETNKQRKKGELEENQSLKNKDKIKILLESDYSDEEKESVYTQIINKKDTTYKAVKAISKNNNIDEYLKYKTQKFESDKEDDGTEKGKTVSGSKKSKVFDYINDNISDYNTRLLLAGMQGTLSKASQRSDLFNAINDTDDLTKEEKLELFGKIKGFTVYKNGTVKY